MSGNVSSRIGYYLSVVAPFLLSQMRRLQVSTLLRSYLFPGGDIGPCQLLPGLSKVRRAQLIKTSVKGMRVVP
jgi:hypothetical protein